VRVGVVATGQLLGILGGIAPGFGLLWLINKFGLGDWYVNNPRSLVAAGRWDVPWESRTALAQAEEGLARAVAPLEGDPKRRSSTEQNPGRFRTASDDRGKPADGRSASGFRHWNQTSLSAFF
jgi:hypothetical protein